MQRLCRIPVDRDLGGASRALVLACQLARAAAAAAEAGAVFIARTAGGRDPGRHVLLADWNCSRRSQGAATCQHTARRALDRALRDVLTVVDEEPRHIHARIDPDHLEPVPALWATALLGLRHLVLEVRTHLASKALGLGASPLPSVLVLAQRGPIPQAGAYSHHRDGASCAF